MRLPVATTTSDKKKSPRKDSSSVPAALKSNTSWSASTSNASSTSTHTTPTSTRSEPQTSTMAAMYTAMPSSSTKPRDTTATMDPTIVGTTLSSSSSLVRPCSVKAHRRVMLGYEIAVVEEQATAMNTTDSNDMAQEQEIILLQDRSLDDSYSSSSSHDNNNHDNDTTNADLVVKHSKYHVLYNQGATALFLACEEGHWESVVEYAQQDPTQVKTWVQSTGTVETTFEWSVWCRLPLHEACRRQAPASVIALLVELYPQSTKLPTQFGQLALHLAMEYGASLEVVHVLLVSNMAALVHKDYSGRTPQQILQESPELLNEQERQSINAALSRCQETYNGIYESHQAALGELERVHVQGLEAVRQQHDDDLRLEQEQQDKLLHELERCKTQLAKMTKQQSEQEQRIVNMSKVEDTYKAYLDECQQELQLAAQDIAEYKDQLTTLQNEVIPGFEAELSELKKETIPQKDSEIATLRRQVLASEQAIATFTKKLVDKDETILVMQSQLQSKEDEVMLIQQKTSHESETVSQEMAELQKKLVVAEQKADKFQLKIIELQKTLLEAEQKAEKSEQEMTDVQKKLLETDRKVEQSEKERTELQKKLFEADQKVEHSEQDMKELHRRLLDAELKVENLENERTQLQNKLAEVEQKSLVLTKPSLVEDAPTSSTEKPSAFEEEDPFGMFGSDEDEDDGSEAIDGLSAPQSYGSLGSAITGPLTQTLLKTALKIPLSKHRVGTMCRVPPATLKGEIKTAVSSIKREITACGLAVGYIDPLDDPTDSSGCYDALVYVEDGGLFSSQEASQYVDELPSCYEWLVPGGVLVVVSLVGGSDQDAANSDRLDPLLWKSYDDLPAGSVAPIMLPGCGEFHIQTFLKRKCRIQTKPCPWLPRSKDDLQRELDLVDHATVRRLAEDLSEGTSKSKSGESCLSPECINQAVAALTTYGYCIIPKLLDEEICRQYGRAILEDLHLAASILLERDGVDLYNPSMGIDVGATEAKDESPPLSGSHDSTKKLAYQAEPCSYKELSMREDFRMDLRHGPRLQALRDKMESSSGNQPWTVRYDTDLSQNPTFFRGNSDMLEVVRRAMNRFPIVNPHAESGNLGRYNFNGSPPLTDQDLQVGIVGGIVSLPKAADQALHADTPHLFENVSGHLPPHYVNAFTPTVPSHDLAGQTALVHMSHRLDMSADFLENKTKMWKYLVRPRLEPGDVLLFDCRILHFGMANTSEDIERPVLYTNVTQHWFGDPKNWDNQKRIFDDEIIVDDGEEEEGKDADMDLLMLSMTNAASHALNMAKNDS